MKWQVGHPKRLLRLADALEKDARNKRGIRFDITNWLKTEKRPRAGRIPLSCGTQACALGYAAVSGMFKRQGLGYKPLRDTWNGYPVWTIEFTYKRQPTTPDEAACNLFGINKSQFFYLFIGASDLAAYKGAEGEIKVAERIRQFVADKGVPR